MFATKQKLEINSNQVKLNQVLLSKFDSNGGIQSINENKCLNLEIFNQIPESLIVFSDDNRRQLYKYMITRDVEYAKYCSNNRLMLNTETESLLIQFQTDLNLNDFILKLKEIKNGKSSSLFDQRTDEASATQYFQFYAYLSQQQNMMQDFIRTSTYQRAISENFSDFNGKVVLDVGAGSGILSFFAAQVGAARVYAIEASSMAQHAHTLIKENNLSDVIKIISGKIEEIELPEKVDVIISEPMGYMLYNERMLESFLHAKKFLKPNGKMYPTQGDLYVAPFNDEGLYLEQVSKASFWSHECFYGINLSSLKMTAYEEYFKQPIVDTFDIRICVSKPVKHSVNFLNANETDLHNINIPLSFDINMPTTIHGLAFWFDVAFLGSSSHIWLSTAPTQPLTHWYQVRCLFPQPCLVNKPVTLIGHAILKANKKQSYDVEITIMCPGSNYVFTNTLDLKNPFFRYTGQTISVPVGQFHESPTEQYYSSMSNQNQMENQENSSSNQQITANMANLYTNNHVNGTSTNHAPNQQTQSTLFNNNNNTTNHYAYQTSQSSQQTSNNSFNNLVPLTKT